ncbi:hypothetical protein BD626DRAFT_190629 [Schizophyllum amplum]|uniref:DUF3955 domain-containing protein n=1 Tax=Schizophyllum amplum TaxID=97359 RepID=A0A550CLJ5_9AGAR|nr:hypothetical protein BD626DRAFT_190629 [Auriculariopsis ampla]
MDAPRSRSASPAPPPLAYLKKRDYIIGILLLLIVVFLWTSSNFVTQALFEDGFEKPFLVTYLNTSSFALYLVPSLVRRVLAGKKIHWRWKDIARDDLERTREADAYQPLASDNDDARGLEEDTHLHPHFIHPEPHVVLDDEALPPLTTQETAKLASVFCFFWFIANWTVNASLDYTSVASTTILSSMSGFFTLGIGRVFQVEVLTYAKLGAVFTSFSGVVLVSLSDSNSDGVEHAPRPMLGDLLALLSAFFYALYVTLLKVRIGSESRIDMQLFFGFVGLFNIITLWPVAVILHFTGVEPFDIPHSGSAVGAILANMAITLSSDYIYVLAMLKTTPLVVTVGLSLTIPLAVVGDLVLGRDVRIQVILGALLVLASFVAMGVDDARVQEKELAHRHVAEDDGLVDSIRRRSESRAQARSVSLTRGRGSLTGRRGSEQVELGGT